MPQTDTTPYERNDSEIQGMMNSWESGEVADQNLISGARSSSRNSTEMQNSTGAKIISKVASNLDETTSTNTGDVSKSSSLSNDIQCVEAAEPQPAVLSVLGTPTKDNQSSPSSMSTDQKAPMPTPTRNSYPSPGRQKRADALEKGSQSVTPQNNKQRTKSLANAEEDGPLNANDWADFIADLEHAEENAVENQFAQDRFLTFDCANLEDMYIRYSTKTLPYFIKRFTIALALYSMYALLSGEFFTQAPSIHRWQYAANAMFNLCWIFMLAMSFAALHLQYRKGKQNKSCQAQSHKREEMYFCTWLCLIVVVGLLFGNRWRCAQLGGVVDGVSDPKVIFCPNDNGKCKGFSSDADTLLALVGGCLYLATHTLLRFKLQFFIWMLILNMYCMTSAIISSPEVDRPPINALLLFVTIGLVALGQRHLEKLNRKRFLIVLEDFRRQRQAIAKKIHREVDDEIKLEEFRQGHEDMRSTVNDMRVQLTALTTDTEADQTARTLLLEEKCAEKDLQTLKLKQKCEELQMQVEELQKSVVNFSKLQLAKFEKVEVLMDDGSMLV
eukprot:gnl/MRDRNA2_/MRDRNA2_59375_c0_seq2.p1 gnl/MRDRNA2_/MRDRNA2_59375_c0~~gnl/MRDRNA2_/MRDRNA2_59375_c0_seq2.p1  ORF type:complete len:571 (-),score=107.61 gnl/MRDRNA2_/MRDRNA2_59375_c0_seq2:552-2222(-)